MDIGITIRRRREELGLSQEELALAVGYKNRSTITKIESGERDFPRKKLTAFSKALGIPTSKLLPYDDETAYLGNILPPDEFALILAFRNAEPEMRANVLRLLGVR